jgi:hypothetical protein
VGRGQLETSPAQVELGDRLESITTREGLNGMCRVPRLPATAALSTKDRPDLLLSVGLARHPGAAPHYSSGEQRQETAHRKLP